MASRFYAVLLSICWDGVERGAGRWSPDSSCCREPVSGASATPWLSTQRSRCWMPPTVERSPSYCRRQPGAQPERSGGPRRGERLQDARIARIPVATPLLRRGGPQ
ncbi:hypothetical protein BU16DRAFT_534783 [Lophium mytilinum]|uniref:Uncharacterized protein n=1 Tax=Lophium mytilinum TaxID=390894 RepID=A0A6A6R9L9_9PEZI|nr:hypothetical protein BU16DRAFT_534783 [Lophium mytilinum]